MASFRFKFILLGLASALILAALGLLGVQWQRFKQAKPAVYSAGSRIADIPVGGLSRSQAADRVQQAYSIPIELHYNDNIIQVAPVDLGFTINIENMLQTADQQIHAQSFWESLWSRPVAQAFSIPLDATTDEQKISAYLNNEIARRYDHPPYAPFPVAGKTYFLPGMSGTQLDTKAAVTEIRSALQSPQQRKVTLVVRENVQPALDKRNLETLLKQIVDLSQFDGLIEFYLEDLKTGEKVHFTRIKQTDIQSDIAFTAASTIKIAIMTSVLRRVPDPVPEDVKALLERMIVLSENPPADQLMDSFLGQGTGPLEVTKDMQTLGFKNTFLAGYFYQGAPLLQKFDTPANTRTDINLSPDIYNQTTPLEMSTLLASIYHCAQDGSGLLMQTFPGQLSAEKCQLMISYLSRNKNGLLIEAGIPEGTQIAHKHGWIEEADGLLHTMSDTGIVYTPGGDYVLTIYVYNSGQLVFDPANRLMARLSEAVYNVFNMDAQVVGLYGRID